LIKSLYSGLQLIFMKSKNSILTTALVLLASLGFSQAKQNIELVAHMPFDDDVSDIWGFEGRDGTEYAILGLHNSTAVISLADPTSPELIARIPGTRSVWRDMKSHGDYVYVVADQGEDGLLIIDMASAPDTVTWDFWKPELDTLGVNGTINKCHNLYIDAGYVYLSGCNINDGGIVILDLNVDPENPRLAGLADPRYSHDNF